MLLLLLLLLLLGLLGVLRFRVRGAPVAPVAPAAGTSPAATGTSPAAAGTSPAVVGTSPAVVATKAPRAGVVSLALALAVTVVAVVPAVVNPAAVWSPKLDTGGNADLEGDVLLGVFLLGLALLAEVKVVALGTLVADAVERALAAVAGHAVVVGASLVVKVGESLANRAVLVLVLLLLGRSGGGGVSLHVGGLTNKTKKQKNKTNGLE